MKDKLTYDSYSRDEIIKLLHLKNRKIDSQRAMLNQAKEKREKLKTKLQKGYKTTKENIRLKGSIEQLHQRIERLTASGIKQAWSKKEHVPIMLKAIIAYNRLKKEGRVTDKEMAFLILGYQNEIFYPSDIVAFIRNWFGNGHWKRDFQACCEARYFFSDTAQNNRFYFIRYWGSERLMSLLKAMYEMK